LDVIAVNSLDRTAIVAEEKRNPENYSRKKLEEKYITIKREYGEPIGLSLEERRGEQRQRGDYKTQFIGLSLENM